MAKKAYIGVNNVARKNKKIFAGVNAVARKIKSGYVGVSGVARKVYAAVEATILSNGLLYQSPTHYATYTGTAKDNGYYTTLYWVGSGAENYAEWKNVSLYGYSRMWIRLYGGGPTWCHNIKIYNSEGTLIVNYQPSNWHQSSSLNVYFSTIGFTPVNGEAYTIRLTNVCTATGSTPYLDKVQFYA